MAQSAKKRYDKSPKIGAEESDDAMEAADKSKDVKKGPKDSDERVMPKAATAATPEPGDSTGTEGVPVNGEGTPAPDGGAMHAQEMADMAKRHIDEMGATHRRHQRERKEMYGRHSALDDPQPAEAA